VSSWIDSEKLFESSITNFIFLTKFYSTFSLDYYWISDLTFIVQQMLDKCWKKVEFLMKIVIFLGKTALNRGIVYSTTNVGKKLKKS